MPCYTVPKDDDEGYNDVVNWLSYIGGVQSSANQTQIALHAAVILASQSWLGSSMSFGESVYYDMGTFLKNLPP